MRYGNSRINQQTPAVDTGIHAAGDVVAKIDCGKLGADNGRGVLKDVAIVDRSNQKAALTLLFFRGPLTGTYTLNGAPTLSAADMLLFVGKVEVAATDYTTVGSGKAVSTTECSIILSNDSNDILTCVVITSGTPTYAGANDLTFGFNILGD